MRLACPIKKTGNYPVYFKFWVLVNMPLKALSLKHQFGVDLKPSFVSDFRRNELDQVNDDIHDVADRTITEELESGLLVIQTVGDYCNHMIRCSKTKPKDIKMLFEFDEKQRAR